MTQMAPGDTTVGFTPAWSGRHGELRASTSMDDGDFDRTMARVLQVSPVEMTFEDGMRTLEF